MANRVVTALIRTQRQIASVLEGIELWGQRWAMTFEIMTAVLNAVADDETLVTIGLPKWAENCAFALLRDARNPAIAASVIWRIWDVHELTQDNMAETTKPCDDNNLE